MKNRLGLPTMKMLTLGLILSLSSAAYVSGQPDLEANATEEGGLRKLAGTNENFLAMMALFPILSAITLAKKQVGKHYADISNLISSAISQSVAPRYQAVQNGNAYHIAAVNSILDAMEASSQNQFYEYSSQAKDSSVDLGLTIIELTQTRNVYTSYITSAVDPTYLNKISNSIDQVKASLNDVQTMYGCTDYICNALVEGINTEINKAVPALAAAVAVSNTEAFTVGNLFQADLTPLQTLSSALNKDIAQMLQSGGNGGFDAGLKAGKWVPQPTPSGGGWTWNSFNPYSWR